MVDIKSQNGLPPVTAAETKTEGHRIYLGRLPFSATEQQVRDFIAPAGGEVLEVSLPLKFGKRPSGFAFIGYKTAEQATSAVDALNDKELGEAKVTAQLARSEEEVADRRKAAQERREAARATRAQEKQEKAIAEGESAEDKKTKPKKKRAPRVRRRAPGEDEDAEEGAEKTEGEAAKSERKPRTRKPQAARIDGDGAAASEGEKKPRARKPREAQMELTGDDSKDTIFVGNLPFSVDDAALAAIFTDLSIAVKSATVIKGSRRDKSGARFKASKGFGFVALSNPDQQSEAVEKVAGSLIGDRKISAKIAQEMKPIEKAEVAAADGAAPAETAA